MMVQKRKISILIPYKTIAGQVVVYLQKRSKDATRLPGHFGFFGGHAQGNESPEETLGREIQEELTLAPDGHQLLGRYEFDRRVTMASTFLRRKHWRSRC